MKRINYKIVLSEGVFYASYALECLAVQALKRFITGNVNLAHLHRFQCGVVCFRCDTGTATGIYSDGECRLGGLEDQGI